ncbi:TetR/AcrR family transcriptional regulator [Streptomyces sp. NBC_00237]|uniref:TetR/AcrR family transcriptional regulator n=1 Tax=Streptomyces sp. NBC_00237 TaxID=2975687 RepID=UPI00224D428A|nr:TetR/AcrR family transcriptional regulator [Streptomyces sp. NBC_00237]MCX5205852.1 TetR/AcrR family transcriptional regulator [Streptomyces sp. NBC_00237]
MPAPTDPSAVVDDKRIVRGDTRRTAILAAATREFGRKGYDRARIADIAREAGVTDAGVLHHFPRKHDLFVAVVELREDTYRAFYAEEFRTVRDMLDALIAAVRRAGEDPDLVRFRRMLTGAAGVEGHPVEGRHRDNLERALERFVPVVRRGVASGELLAGTDPEQIVLEMLALNEGIRDQWVTLPERIDYVGVFTSAVNGLYGRIATDPGRNG